MINNLFLELSRIEQVEAIALGGSRAGTNFDEKSDYDIYIYTTSPIEETVRRNILNKYCDVMEIGNQYWEYEDNCTLSDGIDIDIIYRNVNDFTEEIISVVEKHKACNGYTTCMWYNLKNCKVIYDKNGRLNQAKIRFDIPYPKQLKHSIIKRNMNLLKEALPSYHNQIAKAIKRDDIVSINHRVSEFLASYFDILFAVNELPHPGEKRLINICINQCKLLPANFESNINQLFNDLFITKEKVMTDIDILIFELKKIIA